VPSVCHNNHPTIHPSIYPGPCSDPEWAGSPSLIPIRACLIPKSALPDLEILVLEALSSVCLFCVFFLFFIISRVCDSQRFVRGFFALSCFCAAAADLINVLFREALKICHLFPIESGFCVSSIVARLVIASPPLSRANCFYFSSTRGGEKEAAGGPGPLGNRIASHWIFCLWDAAVRSNLVIGTSRRALNFKIEVS